MTDFNTSGHPPKYLCSVATTKQNSYRSNSLSNLGFFPLGLVAASTKSFSLGSVRTASIGSTFGQECGAFGGPSWEIGALEDAQGQTCGGRAYLSIMKNPESRWLGRSINLEKAREDHQRYKAKRALNLEQQGARVSSS